MYKVSLLQMPVTNTALPDPAKYSTSTNRFYFDVAVHTIGKVILFLLNFIV